MSTMRRVSGDASPGIIRRGLRWTGWTFAVLLFTFASVVAFGTSGSDYAKLATFTNSVQQWQSDTDFRVVASQYCTRGSDAMRSTPMGLTAARWIIAIRSIPGLPKQFAVNDTSRAHYENFSKGPLSAYLHLCTEVEIRGENPDSGYIGEIEARFGNRRDPKLGAVTNDELQKWLQGQHWDFPVTSDRGAVQSVRSMLEDSQASKGFTVRDRHIDGLIRPHIAALARELHFPENPDEMTVEQQYAIWDRLDGYIRIHDHELWRTKQLSDFVGGIWGQVFSPPYTLLLSPYLQVVAVSRWVVVITLVLVLYLQVRRMRRLTEEDVEGEEPDGEEPGQMSPSPA
jgi:hypothetical protein